MKTFQIYQDLIKAGHILIGGSTGSGKSTLIDALIYTACLGEGTAPTFYLIDPKRISLRKYRNMKIVAKRVTEMQDAIMLLQDVNKIMDDRYTRMEQADTDFCNERKIYVVIDEFADLVLNYGKQVTPLIQRLAAMGRQCNISVIMATQTVLASIVSTPIKNNFTATVALRTKLASQSRLIADVAGAEKLPEHGYGLVSFPQTVRIYELPKIPDEDIKKLIKCCS